MMCIMHCSKSKDFGISPSDTIDQAWHLHQQNSHWYKKMCEELFDTKWIGHNPNDGSKKETQKCKNN